MLVIFSVLKVDRAVDRAFNLVKENGGQLFVIFFLQEKIPSALSSLMKDTGFLGEKVQEDVKDTIREEYDDLVDRITRDINRRAREEGVEVSTRLVKKESLTKCYELVKEQEIDHLIINYNKDKYISKVVLDYFYDDFVDKLPISYELYLDGEKQ